MKRRPRIRIPLYLLILASPFLVMVAVNEIPNNPKPTGKYVKERCTWHCHDVSCKHWRDDYAVAPTPMKRFHKDVFDWFVKSLHGNALGLNYGAINLLVYIGLYPLIGGLLVWNLIRKI